MSLNDAARTAITAGRLAHLTTLREDGSPHTVVVWVGLDGEQVVIGKLYADVKVRNIRHDPRVSVSLEAAGSTHGLGHYLVLEGTAEVTDGGAVDLLRRLAKVYLSPDAVFLPEAPDLPAGYVIRITPTTVRGVGPWTD